MKNKRLCESLGLSPLVPAFLLPLYTSPRYHIQAFISVVYEECADGLGDSRRKLVC